VRELTGELQPWLAARVAKVELSTDVRLFCHERERDLEHGKRPARADLVVVLGGDGALLGAVRAFAQDPVPTLGINLGRVGFLASTPVESWREALESVLAGTALLEPRMRIEAEWRSGGETKRTIALNEVALQRSAHQGMLQAALWHDSDWVTTWRADGVIVATPSGSTAYSLSAGGPILEPTLEAFVVTPICPQGLANRPIVLPPQGELTLSVVAASGISTLAVDGHTYHALGRGESVVLRRHPQPYPLYAVRGMDPFRRLRDRLGWRGSVELDPPSEPAGR
jgi:NAD+ kinase